MYIYIYIYTHKNFNLDTCIYIYIYIYTHTHTCAHTLLYERTCMYVCMFMFMSLPKCHNKKKKFYLKWSKHNYWSTFVSCRNAQ